MYKNMQRGKQASYAQIKFQNIH